MSREDSSPPADFGTLQTWLLQQQSAQASGSDAAGTTPTPFNLPALLNRAHQHDATTSTVPGALGCRKDEQLVTLQTGQLHYEELLFEFPGVPPLTVKLHYVAHQASSGILGQHWRLNVERYFEAHFVGQETVFRLFLGDGHQYDFPYDRTTGGIRDNSGLGIRVEAGEKDTFTLHYRDGRQEHYQSGHLLQETDCNGNGLYYRYGRQGRLEAVQREDGVGFSLTYNRGGRVQSLQDHGGRVWQFTYDHRQLTALDLPDRSRRVFVYQPFTLVGEKDQGVLQSALLTDVKNRFSQHLLKAAYDDKGRVISHETDNRLVRYQWHADGSVTQYLPCGDEHSYHLDKQGQIQLISWPDGSYSQQQWDTASRTVIRRDRTGGTESRCFDEQSRLLSETDAQGNTTRYHYADGQWRPTTLSAPQGKYHYRYDERGNQVWEQDGNGHETHYAYNDKGHLITVTDAAGRIETLTNNAAGLPLSITHSDDSTLRFEYDHYGRITRSEDATGCSTRFSYNAADEIIRSQEAHGTTQFRYGPESQLTGIISPDGQSTHYHYDRTGRLQAEERAGRVRQFTHKDGQLTGIQREDGSIVRLEYNVAGQLIREAYGEHITHYAYHDEGQLSNISAPDSTLTFGYTRQGLMETETQNGVAVERTYAHRQRSTLHFLAKPPSTNAMPKVS